MSDVGERREQDEATRAETSAVLYLSRKSDKRKRVCLRWKSYRRDHTASEKQVQRTLH